MKFWSKIVKIREIRISFNNFSTSFYHHYECYVKIWAKRNLNSWFHSTFNFLGFDLKFLILDQPAIRKWPQVLSATTYSHENLPNCVMYKLKVSRVYMRAPLQCWTKCKGWCKFASSPWNRSNMLFNLFIMLSRYELSLRLKSTYVVYSLNWYWD